MTKLHELPHLATHHAKRVGRGFGSGKGGHTTGRGTKGQRSRVGKGIPVWFEGGQLPMVKKLPYLRGKSRFSSLKAEATLVTLDHLEKMKLETITIADLKKAGVIRSITEPVKVLSNGTLTKAIVLQGIACTKSAKLAIEKVGGRVE
ncbi:MAG TPA: 50S ribosomal protein L15 [Candidatus Pacebacteria bacterium]|nr:MAG: 50S ribosomal protein L15 [Microgenomates group bacterium GW2011_GWF1_44_10]OGJ41001.1 MAG: 50S ribosomal protein L15 [Candidatus Pacebacteria bacterium RIFOXYB1_FULL_44_10]HAU99030.1 50S ribosomal protein L15 [Candidatus Paceibacterota bacterium]HAX01255.1 50S ribosomal protein L15 [Candidatus Paceibacterota bacterium]